MRKTLLATALCGVVAYGLAATPAHADDDDASRAARWTELQHAIFGDKKVENGDKIVTLNAPSRALDAALVPVSMTITADKPIKGLYLVIDDNPSPLAAHFTFGPAADPHNIRLRVRVNQYTEMHAVAEAADGTLYGTERFIKAAGGCSAPAGSDSAEALKDIGQMKLRLVGPVTPGKPEEARLMIRHPDFNGMQMNQVTRLYTPARFLDSIDVSYNGQQVFQLETGISLSTDPVITFGFTPAKQGEMNVVARDSKKTVFTHSFPVPPPSQGT